MTESPPYQEPSLGRGISNQAAMVPAGLLRVQTPESGVGDALLTNTSASMWSTSLNDLFGQRAWQSAECMYVQLEHLR